MGKVRITVRFLLVSGMVTFCLSGCGGSGSSSTSAASPAKTAAWTNVSIRAFDGMVNINWDKATGTSFGTVQPTYNIYCSTNPNDIVQDRNRIQSNYAGTSFDYTNVDNGTNYHCAVTQVTAAGEGPPSLAVSATPQAALPAAPFGLKVTALFSNISSVKLEYAGPPTNPATVTYNLYRSTNINDLKDSKLTTLPTFPTTPYIDKGLNNDRTTYGMTYYYALTAVAAGKESKLSPVVSVRGWEKAAPVNGSGTQLASFGSPTNMSTTPANGSCDITWTKAESPGTILAPLITQPDNPDYILYWSYTAEVGADGFLKNIQGHIDDVTKNLTAHNGDFTYKLTSLDNGLTALTNDKTCYIQLVAAVKAANGDTYPGPPGPIVSVTPALKTPSIPSGVSATQGSQQVLLTWDKDSTWSKDSSDAKGVTYNIYVLKTDATSPDVMTSAELLANGKRIVREDSTKTYYNHSGLETGKTYYYVITAVGEGESAPSSIVSVTL